MPVGGAVVLEIIGGRSRQVESLSTLPGNLRRGHPDYLKSSVLARLLNCKLMALLAIQSVTSLCNIGLHALNLFIIHPKANNPMVYFPI